MSTVSASPARTVLGLSIVAATAFASNDSRALGGVCPLPWDNFDCEVTIVHGVTTNTFDPCYLVPVMGDADAYCDLTPAHTGGLIAPNTVYMQSEFIINIDIEAWGDIEGNMFCCALDAPNGDILSATIWGSDNADTLQMRWVDPITSFSFDESLCPNLVQGGIAIDHIEGADVATVGVDALYGGASNDTILGWAGDDSLYGEDGDDTLRGGAGVDHIYGNANNDHMMGGTGDDFMYGNAGLDYMSGGDGDDDMDGGSHGDTMCGDGHVNGDYLYDGDTTAEVLPDKLWGANAADTNECGNANTYWDGVSVNVGAACGGSVLTERPAACP